MSQENKDTREQDSNEEKLSQPEQRIAEGKPVEETDFLANEVKESSDEPKQKQQDKEDDTKEEKASDFMKDDADDLPEDIKKKLEKKKTEKTGKKGAVKKKKKKKTRGKVDVGKVFVKATYNNTIITITDLNGEVISWASAGVAGFKGPKKSTPYASQIITKIATMKAKQDYGLKEVSVFVKGVGMGRESAIRTLNSQGLFVTSIKDITPVPHNGCRPRKPRRV